MKRNQEKVNDPNGLKLSPLLKAAADPLRQRILRVLKSNSFGVQELAIIFDMPQPGMTHHLKILQKVQMVENRREGNHLFYRRKLLELGHPLTQVVEAILFQIDQSPLDSSTIKGIKEVHKRRAESSLNFFEKNADSFKEKQGLVAEIQQYAKGLEKLIHSFHLPKDSTAVEVGPGEGDFLGILAQSFQKIYAIDNSPEMLQKVTNYCKTHNLMQVETIEGDLESAQEKDLKAHLVVLNMVLHHLPSPIDAFQQVKSILHKGGRLLMADLCPHHQNWVRESCGDLWLGFQPDDLTKWANASGFDTGQSLYIGLKNGFQIQLRSFNLGMAD